MSEHTHEQALQDMFRAYEGLTPAEYWERELVRSKARDRLINSQDESVYARRTYQQWRSALKSPV